MTPGDVFPDFRLRAFLLAGVLLLGVTRPAAAAGDGLWSGGVGAGVTSRTAGGDLFTFGGYVERHLSPTFSVGPVVWLAPGDEISEWGASAQVRLRWDLQEMGYPPFALVGMTGLGVVAAQADAAGELPEEDDLSFSVPVGMGVEYAVLSRLALTGTVELRFHTLNIRNREDEASFGFLFGLRWLP